MPLKRSGPLNPYSRRRWEQVTASGFKPVTTFTPRPREPFTAKAKVQRNTGPTKSERDPVRARSGGRCEMTACTREAVHIHHRRPRRMGGSTAPDVNGAANLLHVCRWHHEWIESHRAEAMRLGLLLSARANPLRVPAQLRHDEEPIWLLPDGSWITYLEGAA